MTLFVQDLPGSFEPVDEFAFGVSSLPDLLDAGSEGAFFSYWGSFPNRMILGSTVFLPDPSEREAFDRATAEPDPFLESLFAALDAREVILTGAPSYQQTAAGSALIVSATCMFRGLPERQAVSVALFREGILGVAIFYLYPMGDLPEPDINSLATLMKQKISVAIDPAPAATLPAYFVSTATPSRSAPMDGLVVCGAQCAVSFTIPIGWEAMILEDVPVEGSQCAWGIRPSDWETMAAQSEYMVGEYAFSIAVLDLPLERSALYGYFELESGQWYVSGRQGARSPASAVQARGLTILRGTGPIGIYTRQASYAGLAEAPRAVASDGIHSAVLEAGPLEVEPAFELLLQTLRFVD